jgi:hypothetical protein
MMAGGLGVSVLSEFGGRSSDRCGSSIDVSPDRFKESGPSSLTGLARQCCFLEASSLLQRAKPILASSPG